ncbi:MAG: type III pantothenate kinase, partial [Candidatus Gallimonas sp.]
MIICIDVGNTNIKYAIFDGDALRFSYRVATDLKKTSDEYGAQLIGMLGFNRISPKEIKGGIFSSVVPSLDYTIEHMLGVYLGISPLQLAPGLKTGLNIKAENAREVGA